MAKWVIDTVELKKKQYVIEAYSEEAAIKLLEESVPILQEIVSDSIFGIHNVNEYEFKKDYQPKQRELFEESNDIWRDD